MFDDQVRDPTSAVANVDDYASSAKLLAATTLRNILGTKTLADILAERESIAHDMQVTILAYQFLLSYFFLHYVGPFALCFKSS